LGSLQFVGDLLRLYGSPPSTLSPLDPDLLARRGSYGYTWKGLWRIRAKLRVGVAGIDQFLNRKPAPLLPHEPAARDQALPTGYPAVTSHTFDVPTTEALLASARRHQATVNDLLARDLFLTLFAWRKERGLETGAREWLRLMVPMNMRTWADVKLPSANMVSSVFLDRRASSAEDPAALLRTICDEMNLIKRNHLGLIYLLSLRAAALLPGLMRWIVRRQRFTCSTVLSNLARPFGESPLPQDTEAFAVTGPLEFVPPIRPNTCVAYGVATHAGRLTVSLNADPRFVAPAEAEQLLILYIDRLTASSREADETSPG
jgi:hypothetical protein